jgi:hypothetical protein
VSADPRQPDPIPFQITHGDYAITGFVLPGRNPADRERREPPEVMWGMVESEEAETIESFEDWLSMNAGGERRSLEGQLADAALEAVAEKLPRDLPHEPEWDDNERIR